MSIVRGPIDGNTPFIPEWAESALGPKMNAHERAELQLLREFYVAFEAMHATPDDKFHKNKKEGFAKVVMERVLQIRAMNGGNPMKAKNAAN